jgi:hypothetical protein
MTITEFLLARVVEDEAAMDGAEGAAAWPLDMTRPQVSGDSQASWVVIGRDRVLAECEAKRRIVGLAQSADEADRYAAEVIGGVDGAAVDTDGAGILRALASVYADHPDFDPAWRAE